MRYYIKLDDLPSSKLMNSEYKKIQQRNGDP